jgi:release factor glutamine methyltransferase
VSALNGGTDGLAFYRRIVEAAPGYLKPQGLVVLELGINQASAVAELACMAGFPEVRFKKDYAGIDRIAVLTGR